MIKLKDINVTVEVFDFLKILKSKQRELELQREIYYPSISLYLALKYKICFKNLLLHPKVLYTRKYYENDEGLTIEGLVDKLSEVLTYELLEEQFLTDKEIKVILKVHKKLKQTLENEKET